MSAPSSKVATDARTNQPTPLPIVGDVSRVRNMTAARLGRLAWRPAQRHGRPDLAGARAAHDLAVAQRGVVGRRQPHAGGDRVADIGVGLVVAVEEDELDVLQVERVAVLLEPVAVALPVALTSRMAAVASAWARMSF